MIPDVTVFWNWPGALPMATTLSPIFILLESPSCAGTSSCPLGLVILKKCDVQAVACACTPDHLYIIELRSVRQGHTDTRRAHRYDIPVRHDQTGRRNNNARPGALLHRRLRGETKEILCAGARLASDIHRHDARAHRLGNLANELSLAQNNFFLRADGVRVVIVFSGGTEPTAQETCGQADYAAITQRPKT